MAPCILNLGTTWRSSVHCCVVIYLIIFCVDVLMNCYWPFKGTRVSQKVKGFFNFSIGRLVTLLVLVPLF
jgi:hypothetical protein